MFSNPLSLTIETKPQCVYTARMLVWYGQANTSWIHFYKRYCLEEDTFEILIDKKLSRIEEEEKI